MRRAFYGMKAQHLRSEDGTNRNLFRRPNDSEAQGNILEMKDSGIERILKSVVEDFGGVRPEDFAISVEANGSESALAFFHFVKSFLKSLI